MYPNEAFAQCNTLSRKATGPFGMDHVILALYGPAGGCITTAHLSEEQTRALIRQLELALGALAEKRALASESLAKRS